MKKMKRLSGIILALVLVLSITACNSGKAPAPEATQGTEAQNGSGSDASGTDDAAEIPRVDRAGNTITLPETVETIVSLAPATTQVLCDLGLAASIVAVDSNSPQYAEGLSADITQFNMMEPDLEQITAMKPDLVLASTMSSQGGDDIFKAIKDAGICVALLPTSNTIEDVKKDVQFIADCAGKPTEGKALTDKMQEELYAVDAIGSTITDKKTVLFEISPLPYLYSFGSGVYLNEMIELIGAQNVLKDQEGWLSVTEESALAANPDVVLTSDNFSNDDPAAEIKNRAGWENVNAVKNGEVYYIDNASSSLPNHHIIEALKEMAEAVYPEAYGDID